MELSGRLQYAFGSFEVHSEVMKRFGITSSSAFVGFYVVSHDPTEELRSLSINCALENSTRYQYKSST